MNITVTPRASEELKKAFESNAGQAEGVAAVRVVLAHQCGCGTAKFQMGFDEIYDDDTRIDLGGVTLVVDPQSAPFLEEAQMDYSDDLMGKGFLINTPNAGGGGCGCGGGGHGHSH
jgi:iron-sulfur cluster assembly protein